MKNVFTFYCAFLDGVEDAPGYTGRLQMMEQCPPVTPPAFFLPDGDPIFPDAVSPVIQIRKLSCLQSYRLPNDMEGNLCLVVFRPLTLQAPISRLGLHTAGSAPVLGDQERRAGHLQHGAIHIEDRKSVV